MSKGIWNNPHRIFLEPSTKGLHPHQGRQWRTDDIWNGDGVAYVRADIADKQKNKKVESSDG